MRQVAALRLCRQLLQRLRHDGELAGKLVQALLLVEHGFVQLVDQTFLKR